MASTLLPAALRKQAEASACLIVGWFVCLYMYVCDGLRGLGGGLTSQYTIHIQHKQQPQPPQQQKADPFQRQRTAPKVLWSVGSNGPSSNSNNAGGGGPEGGASQSQPVSKLVCVCRWAGGARA